jgi:SAM-dependent methyltransferase
MKFIRKYADNKIPGSVSNKFRQKRFKLFLEFISDLPKPVKILDAGGTVSFWKQMGINEDTGLEITIINTETEIEEHPSVRFIEGNVKDLSAFTDKVFDVVFSNSVIEHVGNFEDMKKMAGEVTRTGKRYFIQTPNKNFPFEPHFLFPMFQFFPFGLRVFLVRHFSIGWYPKTKDKLRASEIVKSINLLDRKTLLMLFPSSQIKKEKFLFFTKSFIVSGKRIDLQIESGKAK